MVYDSDQKSGSTLVAALVKELNPPVQLETKEGKASPRQYAVTVANIGDSRALLIKRENFMQKISCASQLASSTMKSADNLAVVGSDSLHHYGKTMTEQSSVTQQKLSSSPSPMAVELKEVLTIPSLSALATTSGSVSRTPVVYRSLSVDHKPWLPEEQERIMRTGGYVAGNRVDGSLAISRAFGDHNYKKSAAFDARNQRVVAVADIQTCVATEGDVLLLFW